MENIDIDNIRKAVVVGILAEVSWRNRARRLKDRYKRYRRHRNVSKSLRPGNKRKRPHRLPPGWKDVAVDGWEGMFI